MSATFTAQSLDIRHLQCMPRAFHPRGTYAERVAGMAGLLAVLSLPCRFIRRCQYGSARRLRHRAEHRPQASRFAICVSLSVAMDGGGFNCQVRPGQREMGAMHLR